MRPDKTNVFYGIYFELNISLLAGLLRVWTVCPISGPSAQRRSTLSAQVCTDGRLETPLHHPPGPPQNPHSSPGSYLDCKALHSTRGSRLRLRRTNQAPGAIL